MLAKLSLAGLFLLTSVARAEAAAPTMKDGLSPFIPLILIFGIFYFLIIRPQQKKAKQHQTFLSEMKKGDMVVTVSGIIGTIKNLTERFVFLEIDEGVSIKMLRNQILESANSLKEESKAKA